MKLWFVGWWGLKAEPAAKVERVRGERKSKELESLGILKKKKQSREHSLEYLSVDDRA
jgi:hypothetical protein